MPIFGHRAEDSLCLKIDCGAKVPGAENNDSRPERHGLPAYPKAEKSKTRQSAMNSRQSRRDVR